MNITHPDAGRLPGALGGRGAARSQGASPVLVVSRGKKKRLGDGKMVGKQMGKMVI